MKKMMMALGCILSLGLLGCGGYSQKTTTSKVEGEEAVQSSTQTQTSSSEEGGRKSLLKSDKPLQTAQVSLKVEGMHCGGCTTGVKDCLQKLDGVKEAEVNLEKEEALVSYDPEKVTKEKMVEEINKIGYKASLP